MATLCAGPTDMVETILNQAQVAGIMPVGLADNIAFPAMQLNITATQVADKHACKFVKLACTTTSLIAIKVETSRRISGHLAQCIATSAIQVARTRALFVSASWERMTTPDTL